MQNTIKVINRKQRNKWLYVQNLYLMSLGVANLLFRMSLYQVFFTRDQISAILWWSIMIFFKWRFAFKIHNFFLFVHNCTKATQKGAVIICSNVKMFKFIKLNVHFRPAMLPAGQSTPDCVEDVWSDTTIEPDRMLMQNQFIWKDDVKSRCAVKPESHIRRRGNPDREAEESPILLEKQVGYSGVHWYRTNPVNTTTNSQKQQKHVHFE